MKLYYLIYVFVDRGHTFLRLSSALVSSSCLTNWWIKFARYALDKYV